MTFEGMEKSVGALQDNQIVQGYRLGRTESNLDRLEADLHRLGGVVEKLAEGFVLLQSAMKGMVQSVDGLSATVERFIRGMEHNGHRLPGSESEGAL
jgi:archaellum component FlaC